MKRLTVEVLFSFDGLISIKMILLVLQQVILIFFALAAKLIRRFCLHLSARQHEENSLMRFTM